MVNFKQNFVNLGADLFDKANLICLIYKTVAKILSFTLTVKAKPDVNPYKQIPGIM